MCTLKSYIKIFEDNRGADQNSAVTKILCTLKSNTKILADNRGADQKKQSNK